MTAYVWITFGAHSSTITVTPKIAAKRNGLGRAVGPARVHEAVTGNLLASVARRGRRAGATPAI